MLYEYDIHQIDGFIEGIYFEIILGVTTNKALKNLGHKLPYILSRSTFSGNGKYTFHWGVKFFPNK